MHGILVAALFCDDAPFSVERRRGRVVRATRLWRTELPNGRGIEPRPSHLATGKLFCVNSEINEYPFRIEQLGCERRVMGFAYHMPKIQ